MQTGTSDPQGKGSKQSTVGSKVEVTEGRSVELIPMRTFTNLLLHARLLLLFNKLYCIDQVDFLV